MRDGKDRRFGLCGVSSRRDAGILLLSERVTDGPRSVKCVPAGLTHADTDRTIEGHQGARLGVPIADDRVVVSQTVRRNPKYVLQVSPQGGFESVRSASSSPRTTSLNGTDQQC